MLHSFFTMCVCAQVQKKMLAYKGFSAIKQPHFVQLESTPGLFHQADCRVVIDRKNLEATLEWF